MDPWDTYVLQKYSWVKGAIIYVCIIANNNSRINFCNAHWQLNHSISPSSYFITDISRYRFFLNTDPSSAALSIPRLYSRPYLDCHYQKTIWCIWCQGSNIWWWMPDWSLVFIPEGCLYRDKAMWGMNSCVGWWERERRGALSRSVNGDRWLVWLDAGMNA